MLWSYLIFVAIWTGYEILTPLVPDQWDQMMILACSVPFGFTLMSWAFLFLRLFAPLDLWAGITVSVIFSMLALFLHQFFFKRHGLRPITFEFVYMITFSILLFIVLIDRSILQDGIGSSGTVFSDLPFHLGLISSFAYGANSENSRMYTPFYFGEKLSYPIIPDFFSSVLVGAGLAPIRIAIAVPTLLLLISTVLTVHYLSFQFSFHKYVPEFAVFCFFFASGVGWKWFFLSECRDDPNSNLAHSFCRNKFTFWIHPLIHFMLPQRSALFSIPLCIPITSLLIFAVDSKLRDKSSVFLAGVLMGILPLLSAHSYIGVGEYAIFLCLLNFPFNNTKKWIETILYWAIFGGTALIFSIPQVLWLLRVPRKGFMTLEPIVTESFPGSYNFALLWWESLGTFVYLALFISFLLMGRRQARIYLPSIGVFVISNFIRYQPGAMDNNKVFFAGWYPLACASVSNLLICLIQNGRKNIKVLATVLSFVIISFSFGSFVCIFKAIKYSFPLFSKEDLSIGEWIIENTRKDAIFLGSGWHSSTPMSIGGRQITMGYGGWVWTHGLDFAKRMILMKELVDNRENVSLFNDWNIKYAISRYDDDTRDFYFAKVNDSSHWIQLLNVGTTQLYRLIQE